MRYLFYLLILANVILFLWEENSHHFQEGSEVTYRELPIPGSVERILLLRELPTPPKKANRGVPVEAKSASESPSQIEKFAPAPVRLSETQSTSSVAGETEQAGTLNMEPAAGATCFQIGPFQTKTSADELLSLIKMHADQASVMAKPGDIPEGWWVLFPKAENIENAKANRQMLLDKGIRDIWLFDKGELKGAISLGLYKTRERAELAQKQFAEKNIMTEIVPRLIQADAYWVRIPWSRTVLELEEIVQALNTASGEFQIPAPMRCN